MLHRVILAGLSTCVLALTVGFSQSANAQTAYCWINAKDGTPVPSSAISPTGSKIDPFNPNQATISGPISGTFGNYVRGPDGSWINAKDGTPVPSSALSPTGSKIDPFNPNQATISGPISGTFGNYVRVPCPPSTASSTIGGGYLGGELVKNWGWVRSTERLATTDVVTNQFSDRADPLGVGIVGGYNFKPWNNNFVIGPFASFDYLNQSINHNFAGGQFLGTTTHWFINAGVKAGVVTAPGIYLYGLAGAAFLNHDLNVNFATAAQSNVTTPGFTLGLGGEYQPSSWRLFGNPVSVFLQYQHTWWSNANFNTPTSSPAFNYAFKREDDTFKLGVNVYLGR